MILRSLKTTSTKILICAALTIADAAGIFAAQQEPASRLQVRDGLPNVAAKLEKGRSVNVVFLGGSITVGGGASSYVATTERWLKEKWPQANITVFNAGISGTDSNYGAKRYDRDVLSHHPDLVLIEFAVNDGQRDHTAHMERMIHKTWLKNPETDLVFFYTLSKEHLEHYKQGRLPIAASFHERVAAHYGIPTIGLGKEIADKIEKGEIQWEEISRDSCHPNAIGYKIYNAILQETLSELLKAGTPGPHNLKEPLTPNLQIYPPPIQAEPMTTPTFVDKDGRKAIASYSVPVPGVNWVGTAEFPSESGKTLWRIHWMEKRKTALMDERCEFDKSSWSDKLATWFEEDKCFTGAEGNAIFKSKSDKKPILGFSSHEVAVLVFVAPETGDYCFRIGADKLVACQNDESLFALNVAYYKWGEKIGSSIVHVLSKKNEVKPFNIEKTIHMVAGEELAVIVCTDSPSRIRGGWEGFCWDLGLMEKKDTSPPLSSDHPLVQ